MPINRDPTYEGPKGIPDKPAVWVEVRRLIRSSPHFYGASKDIDGDDLLQEVMLGIYKRQQGTGAFDRSRASLGRYVRMVTYSVIANQIDKVRRARRREVIAKGEDWTCLRRAEMDAEWHETDAFDIARAVKKAERRTGRRILVRSE